MNIFKEITKSCDRQDCRLVPDGYGITNAAGHGTGISCRACGREWSVFYPSRWGDEQTYDRDGNDISKPPEPPQIREITGEREKSVPQRRA